MLYDLRADLKKEGKHQTQDSPKFTFSRKVLILTNTVNFPVKSFNFHGKNPNFYGFYIYFHGMSYKSRVFSKMSTFKDDDRFPYKPYDFL